MTDKFSEILKHFSVDRDAPSINRGFYYQHLSLLQKWIDNFIQEKDSELFSDVDEDIKEVGNEIVFTQVKCYSTSFSLNTGEVQKALFSFYINFLKYRHVVPELKFVFQTNTSVGKNEKILTAWISDPQLNEPKLRAKITLHLKEIVARQFKIHRDKILGNVHKSEEEKEGIKTAYKLSVDNLEDAHFDRFVLCVGWEFKNELPEIEILKIEGAIQKLLENPKFGGYPSDIIASRLLSEIFSRSSKVERKERKLTGSMLGSILAESAETMESYINVKLLDLFGSSYFSLLSSVTTKQKQIIEMQTDINDIKRSKHPKKYGRELTHVPKIYSDEIIGRKADVGVLKSSYSKVKIVALNGTGGVGKSSVAKVFVSESHDEFDFVIWLDGANGIKNALCFNDGLLRNLHLSDLNLRSEERYERIISEIAQLPGKRIIVIDNFVPQPLENVKDGLDRLLDDQTCLLITSRSRFPFILEHLVAELPLASAKALARKYAPTKSGDDSELHEFFETVEYNTLMIEVCAKNSCPEYRPDVLENCRMF